MSGFRRDKTPAEIKAMFKEHLSQWDTEVHGRPTYAAMAGFLNERGALTARGAEWSGQTLFLAGQRYGVNLLAHIPAGNCDWIQHSGRRSAQDVNRERTRANNEVIRSQMIDWARRFDLKLIPSATVLARDLNSVGSTTSTGKQWAHSTVVNALVQLGYHGEVALLLASTGWVVGTGWTPEDIESYEVELRREKLRPRYEVIVAEGLDFTVPETLPMQLSLVKAFEGLESEEAVLKYSVVPYETSEVLALLGEDA